MLNAQNLSKIYRTGAGEVSALSDFSHKFAAGSVTAIMGPSGSGKSTLLNVIAGLDVPTSGAVYLADTNLTTLPEVKRAELRLNKFGFVFQSFNLVSVLSAEQNVSFPMGIAGLSPSERSERARALLSRFGLEHRFNYLPFKLSGGERQRVALARALANNPDVIFADEPTGNLDSKSGEVVLGALRELADEGRTIIVVTHDSSLTQIADEVVRLKDGQQVKDEHALTV